MHRPLQDGQVHHRASSAHGWHLGRRHRRAAAGLSAYAIPLGEAFQLRDDLLGVYGNPAQTGKSTLDDLREGKHTTLVTTARDRATVPQQHLLWDRHGSPDLADGDAEEIRDALSATGARHATEQLINDKYHQAIRAPLSTTELRSDGAAWLRYFAHIVTTRSA